jgi:hypothetical protein
MIEELKQLSQLKGKSMPRTELLRNKTKTPVKLEPEVAIAILGLFSSSTEEEGIIPTEEFPLEELLEDIDPFGEYTEKDFEKLTDQVNTVISQNKIENLIPSAIASLTKNSYRESVYIIALLIIGFDEDISKADEKYLLELQVMLKISEERAGELITEVFEELDP